MCNLHNILQSIPLDNQFCPTPLRRLSPIGLFTWGVSPSQVVIYLPPLNGQEIPSHLIFTKDLLGILILEKRTSGDVNLHQGMPEMHKTAQAAQLNGVRRTPIRCMPHSVSVEAAHF
ncbi:MAG: hypothetical protein ACNA8H_15330 [Anaerolineales bacterium]